MTYLYAAYVATWAIHIAYIGHLLRGYARVKREIQELEKKR
ncbi:MAG: hypothetical protein ACLP6G_06600 [Terriglobales bacterium]